MYNTKLNSDDRYIARCITVSDSIVLVDFIVDTGAIITCCNADYSGIPIEEESLKNNEIKVMSGFVSGTTVKCYKYHTRQFTVGTINMGARDIWITFDSRVTDNVLGMDILKDMDFEHKANACQLVFYE